MSTQLARLLSGVLLLLCSTAIAAQATAGDANAVLDIRLGLTQGRTRIVFDMTAPPVFTMHKQQEGGVLVFDLEAGTAQAHITGVDLAGSAIQTLTAEQLPTGGTRITLRLNGEPLPHFFPQTPHGSRGHRLVLDLTEVAAVATTPQIAPLKPTPETAPATAEQHSLQRHRETAHKALPDTAARPTANTPPPADMIAEWSGYLEAEVRLFPQSAEYPGQDDQHGSIAFSPEFHLERDNGRQLIAFNPFMRYDFRDGERSHVDLRELYWQWQQDRWLVKAGVDVVFWGVTESQHLVDIINQTDLVENIDGEDKLGQPMINVDYSTDNWGTLQAYILPWFRERTYPGKHGRLRTHPAVDTDDPVYDSSDEEEHIDLALRWSHYIGDWDLGVAHFSGTSRTPLLLPTPEKSNDLVPLYLQIDQTSIDAQATKGAWLWKLEALYNDNKVDDYFAAVGGFEFTWYNIGIGAADLGWLLEYHYDQRDERAQTTLQEDLYAGVRWSGNDLASTQVLLGVIYDLDNNSVFGNLEATRRLGESWLLSLEARLFTQVDRSDPLWFLRKDDYLELQLQRYF